MLEVSVAKHGSISINKGFEVSSGLINPHSIEYSR